MIEVVKNLKNELKENNKEFDEIVTINVRAEEKTAIFSEYNYDANEVLNPALTDFLLEKARDIPAKSSLRVKIFTNDNVDAEEVKTAYKNKFKGEFDEQEHKLKRNGIFALIMLILGVLFLGFLILEMFLLNDFVFSTILEIAVWVFVWEAVDKFFLERSQIRRRRFQMARLYYAQIEVVGLDFDKISQKTSKKS